MNSRNKCFSLDQNARRCLLFVLICVMVWCLVAHGYGFGHLTLSHDSLKEYHVYDEHHSRDFTGTNIQWKIALGRFLEPVYHLVVRGPLANPWLVGVLTIIWLTLAVYFTTRLFSIQSYWLIALTAGIFCVNIPVTAMAATYITDLDANMFAVFSAAAGAWIWAQEGDRRSWLAILPMVVALGIYQCMISVSIVLIMLTCLLRLLEGRPTKAVLIQGMKGIVMLAIAGALYWILVHVASRIGGTPLIASSNGLTHLGDFFNKSIGKLLLSTYHRVYQILLTPPSLTSNRIIGAATVLLLLASLAAFLFFIFRRATSPGARLLSLALVLLMPFGMNLSCFLNGGAKIHHLMMFASYLTYPACLLLVRWLCRQITVRKTLTRFLSVGSGILVALVIWMNVQTANAVYVKKEIERQETYTFMEQVLEDLASTEGYVAGETKVAMFGRPPKLRSSAFTALYTIVGESSTSMISNDSFTYAFFDYGIKANINLVPMSELIKLSETAEEMPHYPEAGSIGWSGDILVVNLS